MYKKRPLIDMKVLLRDRQWRIARSVACPLGEELCVLSGRRENTPCSVWGSPVPVWRDTSILARGHPCPVQGYPYSLPPPPTSYRSNWGYLHPPKALGTTDQGQETREYPPFCEQTNKLKTFLSLVLHRQAVTMGMNIIAGVQASLLAVLSGCNFTTSFPNQ